MTIDKELEAKILRYHHVERWGVHTIATQLGVHHSTVDRVLAAAGLPKIERAARPSILDPYLPFIIETLEAHPTLSAVRLLEMARVRGYAGASSHFRARVAQMRPRKRHEAYLRLSTLPGEQIQCDWAHAGHLQIGRARRPLMAFVMVLSFSRQVFLRFYLHGRTDSFIRGHVAAFEAWGGVARVVLYDNLKSAVIARDGNAIQFNPQLLELAAHYRYEPRPVAPYRANEKGRVERAVRFIRSSFLAARTWKDLDDLNAQADTWCEGVSANRPWPDDSSISVREAFAREQPHLLQLPEHTYPTEERVEVRVHKTPYIRYDLNDYSVPHTHVRSTVTLMATLETVRILDGNDEIARHVRCWDKDRQIETAAHIEALVAEKRAARMHRGQNRLRHVSPSCAALIEAAAARGTPLRSLLRELERLLDQYHADAFELACAEVLERGVPHANAVRQSLERQREEQRLRPLIAVPLPESLRERTVQVRTASLADYNRFHHYHTTTTDTTEEDEHDAEEHTTDPD